MKDVPEVGKLLDASIVKRDAIHVAVAPLEAAMDLKPGEHVGLTDEGRAVAGVETIGIVDPFLEATVKEGERFYLFLYPGTITSLHHVWTAPAFEALHARRMKAFAEKRSDR